MNTATLAGPKGTPAKMPPKAGPKAEQQPDLKTGKGQGSAPKSNSAELAKLKTESMDSPGGKPKALENQSKEVREYLKVIDKLEKEVTEGTLTDEQLEETLTNLDKRVELLVPEQKKKLLKVEFYTKNNIEDLKTMKKTLGEFLKDPIKRIEVFEMLRDPQFIALLNDLPDASAGPSGYDQNAQSVPNKAEPMSTTSIKA